MPSQIETKVSRVLARTVAVEEVPSRREELNRANNGPLVGVQLGRVGRKRQPACGHVQRYEDGQDGQTGDQERRRHLMAESIAALEDAASRPGLRKLSAEFWSVKVLYRPIETLMN